MSHSRALSEYVYNILCTAWNALVVPWKTECHFVLWSPWTYTYLAYILSCSTIYIYHMHTHTNERGLCARLRKWNPMLCYRPPYDGSLYAPSHFSVSYSLSYSILSLSLFPSLSFWRFLCLCKRDIPHFHVPCSPTPHSTLYIKHNTVCYMCHQKCTKTASVFCT